jgi:hypothetical protein
MELVDGTPLLRQFRDITPVLYSISILKKGFNKQLTSSSHCNNSIPHVVRKGFNHFRLPLNGSRGSTYAPEPLLNINISSSARTTLLS